MRFWRSQVLLGGVTAEVSRRLVTLLSPYRVDLQRVPWPARVAGVATGAEFDAVILAYPVTEPSLQELLGGIRSPGSRSRNAAVVLLCRAAHLDSALELVGDDVDDILLHEQSDGDWRQRLLALLEVSERHDLRAPVQVRASLPETSLDAVCETHNVSMSGMLVRCPHQIPVGVTLRFELSLPGDPLPIRGEAHVVRRTDESRESVHGVGARFLSFLDTDRSRLRSLLAQRSG